jgi:hypothetical protein
VVNLVRKGQKQPVNVIYLKRQLKLYLPKNTPPLRLLNAKQLEEVDKYLNSPKRLQEKRQGLDKKRKKLDEQKLNVLDPSKTFSKDWQFSYEQARNGTKKKTKKRR